MKHAGVAITAPFTGALYPVSSLHSVPRAAFGVAMLTLLRVPFLEGDAQWRTAEERQRP